MYEDRTFDNILAEMLDNITVPVDKYEGSLIYDALAPVAMELEQVYIELDEILKKGFAKTSYEEYLDMRAAEHGVYRKDGTNATGTALFSGADNTIIPKGTIIQTESSLQYQTVEAVTIINGTATVKIQSADIGTVYNVPLNTIKDLPASVMGVSGVTNNTAMNGGTDVETDESLLNRLLLAVQNPPTSGNTNHYKQWAMEVNGVGDAIILPLWNGNGTVKVVLLDSNKRSPSQDIVTAVQTHVENERPIGATVTYQAAVEVPINIIATFQIASYSNADKVKTAIQTGVTEYLKGLAFKDPLVRYTRIENVLLDIPDVVDYSNLTVNGANTNIEIEKGSVAVLGGVTVNV